MITTIIAAATLANASVPVDAGRFLSCIRQVEGHSWTDAGGKYAFQPGTWRQHTRLPYRLASVAAVAEHIAALHLAWLERSLRADGLPVNPYSLGVCWRYGFEGFKRRRYGCDYGNRVFQLYNSTHTLQ